MLSFVSDRRSARTIWCVKIYLIIPYSVLLYLEELYGDFEDLETGEVHKGQKEQQDQADVRPLSFEYLKLSSFSTAVIFHINIALLKQTECSSGLFHG